MRTELTRGSLALVLSMIVVVTHVNRGEVGAHTTDTFVDDNSNLHEANIEFSPPPA